MFWAELVHLIESAFGMDSAVRAITCNVQPQTPGCDSGEPLQGVKLNENTIMLVVLGLIWSYLHHLIAGVRHLWMDATHSVSKAQGQSSAYVTLGLSIVLTLLLGAKLFGLY